MLEEILKVKGVALRFTMLEAGAVPLTGSGGEPFHRLPKLFPGSCVLALEVDEEACKTLN